MHRRVKNHRLASAGYNWTFAALSHSPGARRHYDRRRAGGEGHPAALRNLYNRFLGQLYHCLQTGQHYNDIRTFGVPAAASTETADSFASALVPDRVSRAEPLPVGVDARDDHLSRRSSST
jgi:hypothetical protein